MRSKPLCSITSANFRCEWRPSRWQAGALLLLGLLAAISLLNCELEKFPAWLAAMLAIGWAAWLAVRGWRKPCCRLLVPSNRSPASIDGQPVDDVQMFERGPLLLLRWHSGKRRGQLLFWPDTLPRARRRELRLAMQARAVSR